MRANAQTWDELNDSLYFYFNSGEYEKGITVAEKAVLVAKKQFGEDHPSYAMILNNLSLLYTYAGQYEKAEPLCILAIEKIKNILGESDPSYAKSLNNLAILYKDVGQYNKAESLYIQSKDIRKKVLGESDPAYALSLLNLADLYHVKGEYAKSEALNIQAKEIYGKNPGVNSPEYAASLNNLAALYTEMSLYTKAESLFIRAKEIKEKSLGTNHPDYALCLNNLASLYRDMGQYEKARELFTRSLKIREKVYGVNHPDYAGSLNNLAGLYDMLGQYEKAESLFVQSKEINKNVFGENHPDYAMSLNNLARMYQKTGQYGSAEKLFIRSGEIIKEILGESGPAYAISLNNLGELYRDMGQYEKAEPLYLQANDIYKNFFGDSHPNYATMLNNLALLYSGMGQYEKAKQLFIRVEKILKSTLGETHPDYARCLNNAARVCANLDQHEKAEELFIRSNEILKKSLGEEYPDYVAGLNNLSTLYIDMGDYEKAKTLLLRAAETGKRVLGENHPDYAKNLLNLSACYLAKGNYEKAEMLSLQANAILKKTAGENHPDYAAGLTILADMYKNKGDNKKAESLVLQIDRIEMQNMLNFFTVLSEKEKGNYINNNFSSITANNSFIYNYKKASGSVIRNNYNQQLVLKSLILAETKDLISSARRNSDTLVQRLMNSWQTNKKILAKQYTLPKAFRRNDLKQVETETEAQEKELGRRSSEFRTQQHSIRITLQDVQKNLAENEVAIEFVSFELYNRRWTDSIMYAAYILRKNDSVPVFVPLCEERQFQLPVDSAGTTQPDLIRSFYKAIKVGNKKTALSLGNELYRMIWQPLEPYLKGIKKVSYSPAGKIFSLAMQVLPVDSVTLLMDRYELQQYTGTRQVAMRKPEDQTIKPGNIVLFGNASFTMDSLELVKKNISQKENRSAFVYAVPGRGGNPGIWNDLPGTAEEVNTIKELFGRNHIAARSFLRSDASEDNLKTLSGNSPQVLHIATHGFFLPDPYKKKKAGTVQQGNTYTLADDPLLRGGLMFAGCNYAWSGKNPVEGVDDGIATGYEISQLNLSNTELVVLSACETALGDVQGSEGVFGLQRAFKIAGVKKLIVSLWQVPDKETAELMTGFYDYWMKGKSINDAFAQAQADMRKKYSPFYWAAFVLVE